MHNDIMAVASKERPPMLAPIREEWENNVQEDQVMEETYENTSDKVCAILDADTEAVYIIHNGMGNHMYSNVDTCYNAKEMWLSIERLMQGESINKQDVKTHLFWEFGKFISRDGESLESYYIRFYKMMNETQATDLDIVSYLKPFDIFKQHLTKVNEIRIERLARNARPLALVASTQHYPDNYPQAPLPSQRQTTSTRSNVATKSKGKDIVSVPSPLPESDHKEDSNEEQTQRDEKIERCMALITKTIKNIYKPTNNNLRTSSNNKNKNVDNYARIDKRIGQYEC
ncbi:hypothetical protein Tco_0909035 [Tanacetum coccineum]|uniref:Gag-Pol polyprotein n=1 Tax=Tanacetum coccineum TaxID=301880 RepID=A0ABQ5CP09_9ASTR